ncbi:CLIP domain-containing serine protease 2-like [Glossina fuscipes]|uniref:CLIP domain-containing serine protease 2-like n=1 Tax=Glossina fuscipes TaxID=7396 RepID=A0A9C6DLT7_9MUSC|nr:CLIP domain-containing serine protease 2-like [Glossina fuscipes]
MIGLVMKLVLSSWSLYVMTIAMVSANECALNTECVPIVDCPFIRDSFSLIKRKPYCNLDRDGTNVCCLKPPQNYTQAKDYDLRIVRECRSYRSLPRKCSVPLIVGGLKAKPKEFPFMALLYYKNEDKFTQLCGGTLISNKYVLTAAHCFYETSTPPNWVRLGELDYSTDTDDASPQDFKIENFIPHHQYYTTDIQTKYNDIALVELAQEASFNDYVSPACLPLVDGNDFQEFLAAGWGLISDTSLEYSSHLLKVKLDRYDDDKCFEIIERNEELEKGVNNRTQICATSFSGNNGTCLGDSGGALFVNHPEFPCEFLVVGITSFGEGGCGNQGIPSVYTRVKLYIDWIERIIWD